MLRLWTKSIVVLAFFASACAPREHNNDWLALLAFLGGIQAPASSNAFVVQAVDARTGGRVVLPATSSMTIRITGTDADKIVNAAGSPVTSVAGNQGSLELFVKQGVEPGPSAPLKFKLIIEAAGYFPAGYSVTLTEKGTPISVPLVSMVFPPDGVTVRKIAIGTANGTGQLTAPAAFSSGADSSNGIATQVSIPSGTLLLDAGGNPLTGVLTATMAQFSSSSTTALLAFPGGLEADISTNETGDAEEASFVSGGLLALEVKDASGRAASSFSDSFQVTAQLPSGSTNPLTGGALSVGDTIPVWSYNESTGQWRYESQASVASNSGGFFNITYSSNHLSYYNLDWKTSSCMLSRAIQVTGTPSGTPLTIVLTAPGFAKSMSIADNTIQFARAPAALGVTLTAYYNGQSVGSIATGDLCAGADLTLPVTIPEVSVASFEMHARASCASPALSDPNVSGHVFYRKTGCTGPFCSFQFAGVLSSGAVTIPYTEIGTGYEAFLTVVHPVHGQKTAYTTFVGASGGTSTIDVSYCDILTGTPPSPPGAAPFGLEDLTAWNKKIDTTSITSFYEEAHAVIVDLEGNVYVGGTGIAPASGINGWRIHKYRPDGTEITTGWNKHIVVGNSGVVRAFAVDSSNNVYIAGYAWVIDAAQGYHSWRVKKFDKDGTEITSGWDKIINTGIPNVGMDLTAMAIDSTGNVYVGGWAETGRYKDWWIKKFSPSGVEDTVNWSKQISSGATTHDELHALTVDGSDNVFAVGFSGIQCSIKKFNRSGVEDTANWNKTFLGPSSMCEFNAVAVDTLGNVFVGGYGMGLIAGAGGQWWIKKYDFFGIEDASWNKAFAVGNGAVTDLKVDAAGFVYVGGYGNGLVSASSGQDWLLKRFSSAGLEDANWNRTYDGRQGLDRLNRIGLGNGNVYVVGTGTNLAGVSSNTDWWIKRYY